MKRIQTKKVMNEGKFAMFVLTVELLVSFAQVIPMIPHTL